MNILRKIISWVLPLAIAGILVSPLPAIAQTTQPARALRYFTSAPTGGACNTSEVGIDSAGVIYSCQTLLWGVAGGGGGLTIGTTTITGGTSGRVLFDNAGVVGEDADLSFVTDTLTATKVIASTNLTIGAGSPITSSGAGGAIGTAAFKATGTSGNTVPLLDGANTWSGAQTLGSQLLIATSPKITTSLDDTNGNELFKFTATASAVNELTIANAAASGHPSITASGSDSAINIDIIPKSTGYVRLNGFTAGIQATANSTFYIWANGVQVATTGSGATNWRIRSDGQFQFSSTTDATISADTGLVRAAAAVLRATNGSTGAGSLIVGPSTASIGTSGVGVLAIANGTIPSSSPADQVQLYAEDVAASSELKVRDEAGNVTVLSPHDFSVIGKPSEPLAYSFYSERDGVAINIDMLRVVRAIEKLTGEQLVYLKDIKNNKPLSTDEYLHHFGAPSPTNAFFPSDVGGTKLLTPTPGATVTVTIDTTFKHTLATWTAGEAETINISGTPVDGQLLTMIVSNDASLGRVLTLGTGIGGNGILTGIISKKTTITMIASGGTFYEIARTVGF